MIDAISIFTRGGIVLWSYYFIKIKANPIEYLIKNLLLEERGYDENTAFVDLYRLRWQLQNELELIFVIVYQGIQEISYIDTIINEIKSYFLKSLNEHYPNKTTALVKKSFYGDHQIRLEEKQLFKILDRCEYNRKNYNICAVKNKKFSSKGHDSTDKSEEKATKNVKKKAKVARSWADQEITKRNMNILDHSKRSTAGDDSGFKLTEDAQALKYSLINDMKDSDIDSNFNSREELNSDDDSDDADELTNKSKEEANNESSFLNRIASKFKDIAGNKILTENEIKNFMTDFKSILKSKNVADDAIESIARSVTSSLLGCKTQKFTSARRAVKTCLSNAVQKILTPEHTIDIASEILSAKGSGRVYTIVFLGINGVGKSTSLAKIAYYLKKKGLKVMIAACDTFRAGAVEQLRVHASILDLYLYQRGYGKDAASIAKGAVSYAKTEGYDVVLIDTAGRMQDNEPLMTALGRLINMNNPDLVLFVGEALVGNDAVDQLTKFNQKLMEMSPDRSKSNRCCIDGIILTKFDTVDDKVGAALSMSYVTGRPILFIGTGQKYHNLARLQVATVTKALLD